MGAVEKVEQDGVVPPALCADPPKQENALLGLQRSAGNRAVVELLHRAPVSGRETVQRWPWSKKKKSKVEISGPTNGRAMTMEEQKGVLSNAQLIEQEEQRQREQRQQELERGQVKKVYPSTATIGTETVEVASEAEEKEAKRAIERLQKEFGITLSSPTSVQAIKAHYSRVDPKTLDALETNNWTMKELRGVLVAVEHFAPILGTKRQSSSLAGRAQGVTSLGRIRKQVDADYFDAPMIEGVMGEYMDKKNNVTLFDAQTDLVDGRYLNKDSGLADNATTIEANAVHEMAHGLIDPIIKPDWVREMTFWLDANTPSGDVNAEGPPTAYGATNAGEDIAESVAIYFTNRENLKALAPKREAFLDKMVAGWTPAVKQTVTTTVKSAKGTGE